MTFSWNKTGKFILWGVGFYGCLILAMSIIIFDFFGVLGFVTFLKMHPEFNHSKFFFGVFIGAMIAPFAMFGLIMYAFLFSKFEKPDFSKIKKFLKRPGDKENHDKKVV